MAKTEKKTNQDQEQEKKVNTAKKSTYSKKKKVKKIYLMELHMFSQHLTIL